MMREDDILALIASDPWMMGVIDAAARLDLPQWMIGAGFVRNKVWDHLHGISRAAVDTADIDLIYFDPADTREETEKGYDAWLRAALDVEWSAKNQARMHTVDRRPPYLSAEDALSQWVETATCVAATRREGQLRLIAPHGVGDLVNLIVRPSPAHADRPEVMLARAGKKRWLAKWPRLRIAMTGSEAPAPQGDQA
jgi:hypothetical protein